MKIATNTPFSFIPRASYEFLQLGESVDEIGMIVLMLKKNWGSGSISEIKALTHWLMLYPEEVPCYIIGCESTIPDKNLKKYVMEERDEAIRELCDEVLSRSKCVGVRGEITYLYLTQMLGYSEDQVDIIYETQADNNLDRIDSFLKKNNTQLLALVKDIAAFQDRPVVFYERPISFNKEIIVHAPKIQSSFSEARLSADIEIDGEKKEIWCETSMIYQQFLLSERSDAFVTVLLPLAMRTGKNIVCEAPVTQFFLHNLNEILIPHLCSHDTRLYHSKILADSDASALTSGNAVATGMSCGVDSFYTTLLYNDSKYGSLNLTHLYTGNYLYGNESAVYERAQATADYLGLPLVRTSTNVNEALNLPHLYTHFYKTMFGVVSLRKLFKTYFYSSAGDFSSFNLTHNGTRDTADLDLLLLNAFSCPDFQIITGGAKSNRVEKTSAISCFEPAQKYLNVCLYPEKELNCGKCGKCMRTLLTLDMVQALEMFTDVFDIEEYRKTRFDSFVYMVTQKRNYMLSDVYYHFLRTEPDLVKQAEKYLSGTSVNA
jgi:hypothetical protein